MAGNAIGGYPCLDFQINVGVAAKNRNRCAGQSRVFNVLACLLTLICRQSRAIFMQVKSNQQQAAQ
jgi:hypothetical protein